MVSSREGLLGLATRRFTRLSSSGNDVLLHNYRDTTWAIVVEPEFSVSNYDEVIRLLQKPRGSKALDLTTAPLVNKSFFERLAGAWSAAIGDVPRLAIILRERRGTISRTSERDSHDPRRGHHGALLGRTC